MNARFTPLSLAFLILAAACAGGPGPSQSREEAAIAAAVQKINSQKVDYLVSPADLIEVSVYDQKDLEKQARVSQNGTISLPLVGSIKIGGLTVADAEKLLADRLKEYIVAPQVTLFIKEYGNKKIFVMGEVKKPGSFELPTESKLTVLEAVSLAGGFTPIAAPDRTKVMRSKDGKSQSLDVEVSAITRHGQKQKDIQLEPNDIVYVPQSFF